MQPTLVLFDAPGWGTGELWLAGDRVVGCEHPRPRADHPLRPGNRKHPLADRLTGWFNGEADDFDDVELELDDGFYGECARALRRIPRGDVVTYGELAALAGRPGAARAAGTFCATSRLGVFVPCHRVVAANGIGSYGSLGIDYKRRLLALEGVTL